LCEDKPSIAYGYLVPGCLAPGGRIYNGTSASWGWTEESLPPSLGGTWTGIPKSGGPNSLVPNSGLYRTGPRTGNQPAPPRIDGYNWSPSRPGAQPDLWCEESGLIVPGQGGISTFADPKQLPTSGLVYRLPGNANLQGFQVRPDGKPYGPYSPGHHSIIPTVPMSPLDLLDMFFDWPWEPHIVNGQQMYIPPVRR
jgi:hypothetical protein